MNEFKTKIVIKEPIRFVDKLFDVLMWSMGLFFSVILGLLLEKEQLKTILKTPKAAFLGFTIQYTVMPLLSFAFSYIFDFGPIEALALFLYGCCPGGIFSNNFSIIFDADLNLSAVMTFISNMGSLVMIPLWLYTLGSVLMAKAEIHIPFLFLIGNLLVIMIPCLFGLFLSFKYPKARDFALKIAKPFTIGFLIFILAFIIITQWYTFQLMKWYYFLSAPLIPWTGYLLSLLAAYIMGLPWKQAKTIAIETGIQNSAIAFIIIYNNFPSPDAEYGILPLTAVVTLTSAPLNLLYICLKFYEYVIKRYCLKKSDQNNEIEEAGKVEFNDNMSLDVQREESD